MCPANEENDRDGKARRRALARASARERQAAELLGTRRVRRGRFERKPDVEPVTLACGTILQPEVKTRRKLPALVVKALEQASGYGPRGCVPVAVLSATGAEPVIVLSLRAFRRIAGLETSDDRMQLALCVMPDDTRREPENANTHRTASVQIEAVDNDTFDTNVTRHGQANPRR